TVSPETDPPSGDSRRPARLGCRGRIAVPFAPEFAGPGRVRLKVPRAGAAVRLRPDVRAAASLLVGQPSGRAWGEWPESRVGTGQATHVEPGQLRTRADRDRGAGPVPGVDGVESTVAVEQCLGRARGAGTGGLAAPGSTPATQPGSELTRRHRGAEP